MNTDTETETREKFRDFGIEGHFDWTRETDDGGLNG